MNGRKLLAFALTALMVIGLMTMNMNAAKADSSTDADGKPISSQLSDFVTDVKLESVDGSTYTSGNTISRSADLKFAIDFEEKDNTLQFAPTVTYTLPSALVLKDESGTIKSTKSSDSLGTYTISASTHTVTFVFNSNATGTGKNVTGAQFFFNATIDSSSISNNSTSLKFDGVTDPITLKFSNPALATVKKSVTSYDSKTHIATFKAVVTAQEDAKNVTFADNYEYNYDYVANSMKEDGTSLNLSTYSSGTTIKLGDMSKGDTHTITYQLKIKDSCFTNANKSEVYGVGNTAKVSADNSSDDTNTVDLKTDYKGYLENKYVSKSSEVDSNNQTVKYTITIDENGKLDLKGKAFKDALESSDLSYDTSKNLTVTYSDGTSKTLSWSDILSSDKKSFNWTIDTNGKITLTYYAKYDASTIINSSAAKNKATVTDDYGDHSDETTSTLPGAKKISISKSIASYTKNTTTWKITVDVPQSGLSNISIYDVMAADASQGYVTHTSDTTITNYEVSDSKVSINTPTLVKENNNRSYIYFSSKDSSSLPSASADYKVTIYLQSTIDVTKSEQNMNVATLTGKRDQNTAYAYVNDAKVAEASTERTIQDSVLKWSHYYDATTGTITYRVGVDAGSVADLDSFIVNDTYDKTKVSYVSGSAILYRAYTLETDAKNSNINYSDKTNSSSTPTAVSTDTGTAFTCATNAKTVNDSDKETDTKYYILEYKMKLTDALANTNGNVSLTNSAKVTSSSEKEIGSRSTTNDYNNNLMNKYIKNQASSSNNYVVTYEIQANSANKTFYEKNADGTAADLVIRDTPSTNQTVDLSSFVVKNMTDGWKELTAGTDYTISVKDGTYYITISHGDGKGYCIDYSATVNGDQGTNVDTTNEAQIGSFDSTKQKISNTVTIQKQSSGASGSVQTYDISFFKYGSDNATKGLKATFALYKNSYDATQPEINRLTTLTTDDNGKVTYDDGENFGANLPTNTKLILVETSAPSGYALAAPYSFRITNPKGIAPTDSSIAALTSYAYGSTINIEDEKLTNSLTVNKTFVLNGETQSNTDDSLKATFGLYAMNGATVSDTASYMATTVKGKATFTNIDEGQYIMKETSTEDGYTMAAHTYKIIVAKDLSITKYVDDQQVDSFDIENTKKDNSFNKDVILNKTFMKDGTAQSPKTLSATFGLFDNAEGNGTALMSATSDENGQVKFTSVAPGTYYVKETATADHYALSSDVYQVVVSKSGVTYAKNGLAVTATTDSPTIENDLHTGSFTFTKKNDSGKALKGATFSLTDGTNTYTATSDDNGQVTFSALLSGTYTLTETSAPKGYTASTKQATITVADNGTITGTDNLETEFVNEQVKQDVSLTKQFYINEKLQSYENLSATFTLSQDGKEVATATSTASGDVTFKDVAYGTYTLKETNASENYLLDNTTYQVEVTEKGFTITNGKTTYDGTDKLVVKDYAKGGFTFTKKGKDVKGTLTALKGASFTLSNDDHTYKATSNEEGGVAFKQLMPGTYTLKETKSPEGYLISNSNVTVTVSDHGTVLYDGDLEKIFVNTKDAGNITLNKISEDSGKTLEGAVYGLYSTQDAKTESLIGKLTTNKEGIAEMSNVTPGTYYVKEASAPVGYTLDKTVYSVTVKADAIATVNATEGHVSDYETNVSVSKVDENKNYVAGAIMGIYDSEGTFVEKWTTGTTTMNIKGVLKAGTTYILREISAPDGYSKAADQTFTTATYGNSLQELVVVDAKVSVVPSTPATPTTTVVTKKPKTSIVYNSKAPKETTSKYVKTGDETTLYSTLVFGLCSLLGMFLLRRREA